MRLTKVKKFKLTYVDNHQTITFKHRALEACAHYSFLGANELKLLNGIWWGEDQVVVYTNLSLKHVIVIAHSTEYTSLSVYPVTEPSEDYVNGSGYDLNKKFLLLGQVQPLPISQTAAIKEMLKVYRSWYTDRTKD